MKKLLSLTLILLLILTCFGCSNSSNSGSTDSSSSSSTESSSDAAAENSTSSDSSSTSGTATSDSVVGDWEYKGAIDNTNYEIALDLENSGQFEMDIDEEATEDNADLEAELQGTYTAENGDLTLDIVTLQNDSGFFTGQVVENSQLKLQYKVDGNTLEITNAKDLLSFVPAELKLTKDN